MALWLQGGYRVTEVAEHGKVTGHKKIRRVTVVTHATDIVEVT